MGFSATTSPKIFETWRSSSAALRRGVSGRIRLEQRGWGFFQNRRQSGFQFQPFFPISTFRNFVVSEELIQVRHRVHQRIEFGSQLFLYWLWSALCLRLGPFLGYPNSQCPKQDQQEAGEERHAEPGHRIRNDLDFDSI